VQGRQEGRLEGQQAAVRRLVERRFGVLPTALAERIATADEAALDALLDRAIAGDSVTDLQRPISLGST